MTFASDKINELPPYLFSAFQKRKKELEATGVDVIDLGIGAPDQPPPEFVIDSLIEAVKAPENHRYSTFEGVLDYRKAVANFYQRHYQVTLDPETEILALVGSKEGIANLVQALVNPNENVLIPNPGYPVYKTAVHLAGAKKIDLPLDEKNNYTPLFEELDKAELENTKLMFLNYPGNPTAATVEIDTFEKAIDFAEKEDVLVAHDAAYDLVTFNSYKSPSILQVPKAKERAIELGSLSKSFNMTGWRIGYAVGNKEMIKALSTIKSNTDSSQFIAIQKAAATALRSDLTTVKDNNDIFKNRMELVYKGLIDLGFEVEKPKGTLFIWAKVPEGYTSIEFSDLILDQIGVIFTPGIAFGSAGDDYFRISLSVPEQRLETVLERLKTVKYKGDV